MRGDRITPACDVFCLGSVLAYAATGTLPFGTANSGVHALMFRIAQEEPDLERVPEGLADLVRDCLKKDPAARPTLDRVLERTGAEDTVADGRSRDPWLPGALVAQLGRHAVRLLAAEDPEAPQRPTPTALSPAPAGPAPDAAAPGGPPAAPPAATPEHARAADDSAAPPPPAAPPGTPAPPPPGQPGVNHLPTVVVGQNTPTPPPAPAPGPARTDIRSTPPTATRTTATARPRPTARRRSGRTRPTGRGPNRAGTPVPACCSW